MRAAILRCLGAFALAPLGAFCAPDPAFEPLAFLAGHCWRGDMPDGKATDEHCFSWIYEGRFLRDRHVVKAGDKAVYEGETIYYWNAAAKEIQYLYITASGGHSHGRVKPGADAIDFPAATLAIDGKSLGFRSRWKRAGEDAYEVLREYETEKGWMPVRVRMRRVGG
jgi:hypothetical protein